MQSDTLVKFIVVILHLKRQISSHPYVFAHLRSRIVPLRMPKGACTCTHILHHSVNCSGAIISASQIRAYTMRNTHYARRTPCVQILCCLDHLLCESAFSLDEVCSIHDTTPHCKCPGSHTHGRHSPPRVAHLWCCTIGQSLCKATA